MADFNYSLEQTADSWKRAPYALKHLNVPEEIQKIFSSIYSNEIIPLEGISGRKDFKEKVQEGKWTLKPILISKSEFVSQAMTEHLMRNKKDLAIGTKYQKGDRITHLEGALHTFLTPVCLITMTGDYTYEKGHRILKFALQGGREVVLSAAIQPDFELAGENEVIMKIVEVKEQPLIGKPLPSDFECFWKQSQKNLEEYEQALQQHMIYHLTKSHRLPALNEIDKKNIYSFNEIIPLLEILILSPEKRIDLTNYVENQFVRLNGHVISLEVLLHIYLHQLRNEFSVLEHLLPQGYVYTLDPPAIFAKEIGGDQNVKLLNRLQFLAFKQLHKSTSFKNLKIIGFNDYADKEMTLVLLQSIFPDKEVKSKIDLFGGVEGKGYYSVTAPYALVIHNNSDAFGQNIESEGPTSMDGVIGSYSDAASQLQRERKDLINFVY